MEYIFYNDINKFKSFTEFNKTKRVEYLNKLKSSENVEKYYTEKSLGQVYKGFKSDRDNIENESIIRKIYDEGIVKKYEYISPKYYVSAPADSVNQVDIFNIGDSDGRQRELDRLWSINGLTYKFNRGIILIDQTGKKVEDIFDGTNKHHAMRLHEVSTR